MRDNGPLVIVAVLVLAGLVGLFLFSRNDNLNLDRSLIGLKGFGAWTEEHDIPLRRSHRRMSPHIRNLSLRVLPLYDLHLLEEAKAPSTLTEWYGQTTQRDISAENLGFKLVEMPTLLVLPKWRTGFAETGVAYGGFAIPESHYPRLFEQIGLEGLRLIRGGARFVSIPSGRHNTALFHAQFFDTDHLPTECHPEIKAAAGTLLMRCRLDKHAHDTLVLSDPDLLNNHGLGIGDNAAFVVGWLRAHLDGDSRPIYLDTSSQMLTAFEEDHDDRREYTRNKDDLGRLFQHPFNVLWAMLLTVLGVLFWRGARRFGPIMQEREEDGPAKSKTAAIAAKARLLRLSGNDRQLVADFMQNHLQNLVTRTFGPNLGRAGQKRFFAHLARQDAALAQAFEASVTELTTCGPDLPNAELHRRLNTYRDLFEKVEKNHATQ